MTLLERPSACSPLLVFFFYTLLLFFADARGVLFCSCLCLLIAAENWSERVPQARGSRSFSLSTVPPPLPCFISDAEGERNGVRVPTLPLLFPLWTRPSVILEKAGGRCRGQGRFFPFCSVSRLFFLYPSSHFLAARYLRALCYD